MSKMPVDVGKIVSSLTEIGAQRDVPVSVCVVFDPTASEALVNCMLDTFISIDTNAHVEAVVLDGSVPSIPLPCDVCVIVGGTSPLLGAVASAARAKGAPAVVVVERGSVLFAEREAQEHAAEPGAARAADGRAAGAQGAAGDGAGDAAGADAGDGTGAGDAAGKPKGIPLDDIVDVSFAGDEKRPLEELGAWIVRNAPAKRLAIAACFPFVRHPLATELANENAVQNGAIGLVFFVPGADMPLITLNQARMVLQIAAVYGYALDKDRARELAVVVAGGFGFRAIARRLASALPGVGWLVKPTVAASGTLAMAYAAIQYFEDEELVARADAAVSSAADAAVGVFAAVRQAVAGMSVTVDDASGADAGAPAQGGCN